VRFLLFSGLNYGIGFVGWFYLCLLPVYAEYLHRRIGAGAGTDQAVTAVDAGIYLLLIVLPLCGAVLAYLLYRRARGWFARAGSVYLGWFVLLVVLCLALSTLGTRFSMAFTPGAIRVNEISRIVIGEAAQAFVFSHFYVLPWIFLCLVVMSAFGAEARRGMRAERGAVLGPRGGIRTPLRRAGGA